jgi:valyl-tRNA synthetase
MKNLSNFFFDISNHILFVSQPQNGNFQENSHSNKLLKKCQKWLQSQKYEFFCKQQKKKSKKYQKVKKKHLTLKMFWSKFCRNYVACQKTNINSGCNIFLKNK